MADTPPPNAAFLGQLMIELPPESWLPPGFTLTPIAGPVGETPTTFAVTDPSGQQRLVYPKPLYTPDPTIFEHIRNRLGPFTPQEMLTPLGREVFGVGEPTAGGWLKRQFFGSFDAALMLVDLAGYGIDAMLVGGTEELRRNDILDDTTSGQMERELRIALLAVGMEMPMAGRGAGAALSGAERSGAALLERTRLAQIRLRSMLSVPQAALDTLF